MENVKLHSIIKFPSYVFNYMFYFLDVCFDGSFYNPSWLQ